MGVDKMAVVDENLKIHGLQNIRVIDASVMPEITSGNLFRKRNETYIENTKSLVY